MKTKEEVQSELKCCPFCGTAPVIEYYSHNGVLIKCPKCIIQYKQKTLRGTDWLIEKMAETWNQRFIDQQTLALQNRVKELESVLKQTRTALPVLKKVLQKIDFTTGVDSTNDLMILIDDTLNK